MNFTRFFPGVLTVALVAMVTPSTRATSVTLTGWFSCEKCTAPKAARGDFHPSNPVCAKNCIEHGSDIVFVSAERKVLLKVRKYGAAKDDLGYRLEVTGEIDSNAGTIAVTSVKRLDYEGAACGRRPAAKH